MSDKISATRPPGSHPTPEQLYRARRGPRTSEAERWLAHAAACAVCTEEMLHQEAFDAPEAVAPDRLAAAWKDFSRAPQASPAPLAPLAPVIPITRPLDRLSVIAEPPRRPAFSRSGRAGLAAVGLAAALVTGMVGVVGLGGLRAHVPAPQAAPLRGAASQPEGLQPSGLLDAPPAELRFPASPDGEPRRVMVFDEFRIYSWTSPPSTGGRVAFPESERKKLRRGLRYFWTVVEDENAAASSFRLR